MFQHYGEVLNRRRKARGITLNELSERTNIDKDRLSLVELGQEILTENEMTLLDSFIKRQRIL